MGRILRIRYIRMNKIITTTAMIFFVNAVVFCQLDFTRHQFGINASKFVLIFNEQVDNLDVSYRYSIDSVSGVRSSISLDISSADDAINDFSGRIGVDRIFLQKGNWKFYSGFDFNYSVNTLKSSDRTNKKYGVLSFLGFLYHFGSHFSISSEPSLAIFRKSTSDPSSFNPDINTSSYSVELINIGQIKVSFHF